MVRYDLNDINDTMVEAFSVQSEGSHAIENLIKENRHHLNKFLTNSQIGAKVENIIQEILIAGRRHFSRPVGAPDAIKKVIEMSGTKLNSVIVKALVSIIRFFRPGRGFALLKLPRRT